MRPAIRVTAVAAALLAFTLPLRAQGRTGLMGDLLKDISEVETKVVGLAKTMPASAYDWRPAKGVRSTGEVLLHIASDNYFLPALMGTVPPAESGISAKDYKTTVAFEKRSLNRDQIIAEVEKSFAFLKNAMNAVPDDKLDAALDVFGQKSTNRGLWVTTATHLHEHLGQLIAYARSNTVTPPWSK
jgi:uncharacterized damage-inducible protein DinB